MTASNKPKGKAHPLQRVLFVPSTHRAGIEAYSRPFWVLMKPLVEAYAAGARVQWREPSRASRANPEGAAGPWTDAITPTFGPYLDWRALIRQRMRVAVVRDSNGRPGTTTVYDTDREQNVERSVSFDHWLTDWIEV